MEHSTWGCVPDGMFDRCRWGRCSRALLLASALLGQAGFANAADEFHGYRTETLSERRHTGVLTLSHDRAELVIRRTVYNPADISDEATFMIQLPPGAVATRLRSRGIGPSGPWFEGELMEAEAAAAKYKELTGKGGYYPKDPALLSWRSQELLALQVFPCPARSEKVVEYTLELPLRYEHGKQHVTLPDLGTETLSARIQLLAKSGQDTLSVDSEPFASGGYLPPASTEEGLDIALGHAQSPLEAELSSQSFASDRVLTRYAVRAAAKVSQVPKHAYVVVVIDASRSTGSGFEDAAKSALDAYLSQLPDAHVEVLTFDRKVQHQLNGFGNVGSALRSVQTLSLGKANGSEVDRALFEADQLLATAPNGSPRRIVLVTDGRTRSTLTPQRLRSAIGHSGAVVHIGVLSPGEPSLSRNDEHPWAAAVRTTGGLVWDAAAPDDTAPSEATLGELRTTYEEWVRPVRIDNITAFSSDVSLGEKVPQTLAEGEGSEDLYLESSLARSLSVHGELWSTPIQVLAHRDAAQDAHWAALVFGSDLVSELSEPEQMTLAMRGRAVSPVTSYLAIEPGVRPSTDGLEEGTTWGEGIGLGDVGVFGSGRGVGRGSYHFDRGAYLLSELRPELVRCGGKPGTASVELETTLDEVVSVAASSAGNQLDNAGITCLSEAVWALNLPSGFDEENATFNVEL